MSLPVAIQDLLPSEIAFVAAIQDLGFGLIQHLRIRGGELVLDPPPFTVRHVKFGTPVTTGGTSELRQQIAEFLTYVRAVDTGEIRSLEIRHGLPFSMEIELAGARGETGGSHHG